MALTNIIGVQHDARVEPVIPDLIRDLITQMGNRDVPHDKYFWDSPFFSMIKAFCR